MGTDIALSTEFANQQTSLLALLAALDAAGLTDRVDAIHLDDLSRLTMDYAGRFSVEMEYNADYDRMLQILEAGNQQAGEQPDGQHPPGPESADPHAGLRVADLAEDCRDRGDGPPPLLFRTKI